MKKRGAYEYRPKLADSSGKLALGKTFGGMLLLYCFLPGLYFVPTENDSMRIAFRAGLLAEQPHEQVAEQL